MKKSIVGLLILMTVLVGCVKNGQEAGQLDPLTEMGEKEVKDNEAVILRFILSADGEVKEYLEKVFVEEYYPNNPNILIEFETVPFSELDKKIVTAHMGGVNYDLIFTNHPSVGTFAEAGVIANLDEYVADSDIDFENDYNASFAHSAQYKGSQYAMPFETATRVLAINKTMFAEAGLEAPKTAEDMLDVAEVLTKDTDGDGKLDQFGMIMDFGDVWYPTYSIGQWLLGNGSHLYREEGDGYVQEIDTEGTRAFLLWAKEMSKYQPEDFVSYDGTKVLTSFAQGNTGMFIFGPWNYNDPILQAATDLDYELILNPMGSVKSGASLGGWHIAMGGNSKNKDEVWKVLEFLADPEINAKTVVSTPAIFEAYNYPPYDDEKYDVFAEQLKTAEVPNPPILALNMVAEKWNDYFQRYILDDISLENAVEGAAKDIQKILDEE